jgi:hypothetical protein
MHTKGYSLALFLIFSAGNIVFSQASDSIMDGYNARSAAQDRIHDKWSEVNRGVETYRDPTSEPLFEQYLAGITAWNIVRGSLLVACRSSHESRITRPDLGEQYGTV